MAELKKQPPEIIQDGATYVQADPYNRPGVYYRLDIGGAPAPGEQYQATFETKEAPTQQPPQLTKEQIEEKLQANFPTYEAAAKEYLQPTSGAVISETREITPLEKALRPATRVEEFVKEKTRFLEAKEGDIRVVEFAKGAGTGVREIVTGTLTFPYVVGAAVIGPLTKEGPKKYFETVKYGISPSMEAIKTVPSTIIHEPIRTAGIATGVAATFFLPKAGTKLGIGIKETLTPKKTLLLERGIVIEGSGGRMVGKAEVLGIEKTFFGKPKSEFMGFVKSNLLIKDIYEEPSRIVGKHLVTGISRKGDVVSGISETKTLGFRGEPVDVALSKSRLITREKTFIGIEKAVSREMGKIEIGGKITIGERVIPVMAEVRDIGSVGVGKVGKARGAVDIGTIGRFEFYKFKPLVKEEISFNGKPSQRTITKFDSSTVSQIGAISKTMRESFKPPAKASQLKRIRLMDIESEKLKSKMSIVGNIAGLRSELRSELKRDPSLKTSTISRVPATSQGIGNIQGYIAGLRSELRSELKTQTMPEIEFPYSPRGEYSLPKPPLPSRYFFIPPILLGFDGGGGYRPPRRRRKKGKRAYRYTATLVGVQMGKFLKRRTLKGARRIKVGLGSIGIRYPVMMPERKARKSKSRFLFDIFNPFKRTGTDRKGKRKYERGLIKSLGL